jgi:hypothetical protein
MLDLIFNFFSNYLIEFMTGLLGIGLVFRWATWKASVKLDAYFSTFTSEIDKVLSEKSWQESARPEDAEQYLQSLIGQVVDKLPTRNVRNNKSSAKNQKLADSIGAKNVVSLKEYASGDKSFFNSIKVESTAFKSQYPPNFNQLTDRILERDTGWNKVLSFFPFGPISRLNDVLPGLFVVFGIFGTFVGISMALPEIAKMDFNNLEGSGEILTTFVLSVTYAMKTSIAGILYSLLMTVLNTISPVRGLRQKTHKKMATCFENIWVNLHGQESAEMSLAKTLPALLEEVKQIRSELSDVNPTEQKKGA